jgi:pimeloyl-ACP methyl ester carboxylesterase
VTGSIFTTEDDCRLAYRVEGAGLPVLWQHGLGADASQPAEVFPDLAGVQRITLECRGHGESELGDPARLSIASFTSDALALLNHLGIERAVVGGISLGAAIALRMAAVHAERVRALILARPAWVDGGAVATMAPYGEVARLLRKFGPEEGARRFEATRILAEVASVSPDNARSLLWFFTRPDSEGTIALLSRIADDSPGVTAGMLRSIEVPTWIVANDQDFVHPIAYAERLRALIPNAQLRTITSKTVDRMRYVAEFREALAASLMSMGA